MRARIFFLASFCLLFIIVAATAQPPAGDKFKGPDPQKDLPKITADTEINGKTRDQWIALIPGDPKKPDRSQSELAVESIVLYGPELAQKAVPTMIAELEKHYTKSAVDLSVRVAIPPALALILATNPKPNAQEVKNTVAVFRRMLGDGQVVVKIRVAQACARMGPMAKDSIPELLTIARDPNSPTWELRHAAILALGTTSYDPTNNPPVNVTTAIIKGVSDPAIKVRLAALQSLSIVRAAEDKDPTIKKSLQNALQNMAKTDPDPIGQIRANWALFQFHAGPANKKIRAPFIVNVAHFLDHKEAHVRMEVCQTLGAMGPEAIDHGPALLKKGLKDKEMAVMGWAMWALGQMQFLPALQELRIIASDPNVPQPFRDTAQDAVDDIMGFKKKPDPKKGGQK